MNKPILNPGYLVLAKVFDKVAADEPNPQFRAQRIKEAARLRELAYEPELKRTLQ